MTNRIERIGHSIVKRFDQWQLNAVAGLGRVQYWFERHSPEETVYPRLLIRPYVDIFVFQLRRLERQIPQPVESNFFENINLAISIAQDELISNEQSKMVAWMIEQIGRGEKSKPDDTQKARYARWFSVEVVKALLAKTDKLKTPELKDTLTQTALKIFFTGVNLSESRGAPVTPRSSKQRVYNAILEQATNRKVLLDELSRFVEVPALL